MTGQTCAALCGQPTTGAQLCDDCEETLTRHIAELPALAEDLNITITRRATFGDRNGNSRSATSPVPWHDKAARARAALLGDLWRITLTTWDRNCTLDDDHDGPCIREPLPTGGIAPIGRWLHTRINRLLTHTDAGQIANTIDRHTRKCRYLIDRPPERIFAGICSHKGCDTWLYANPGKPTITCHTCGTHHDLNTRRETLRQAAEDVLATPTEISRAVTWLGQHIKPELVRKWAERGRITKRADDDGRPLYRIGDILDLLAQQPDKKAS